MSSFRKLKTGHTVEPIDEEKFKKLNVHFPTYEGLVRLNPGGWFEFKSMPDQLDRIYDFNFKPSDILVMTYPKSGTTWTQEIVWTLTQNANFDNPDANRSADVRSPHIEVDGLLSLSNIPKLTKDSEIMKLLAEVAPHRVNDPAVITALIEEGLKDPRVIKSHLPLPLFPPKMIETSKVIYIARDARDVIISKFHFYKAILVHKFQGNLDEFIESFIEEEQINHPYWLHVKAAYDLRDHPNMLFIFFEDLKGNPRKVIQQISDFLKLERTPEQIDKVVEYTSFKSMKHRTDSGVTDQPMSDGGKFYDKSLEGFFRTGKSGNWKEAFTPSQVERITKWMDKNMAIFPDDFKYKHR